MLPETISTLHCSSTVMEVDQGLWQCDRNGLGRHLNDFLVHFRGAVVGPKQQDSPDQFRVLASLGRKGLNWLFMNLKAVHFITNSDL